MSMFQTDAHDTIVLTGDNSRLLALKTLALRHGSVVLTNTLAELKKHRMAHNGGVAVMIAAGDRPLDVHPLGHLASIVADVRDGRWRVVKSRHLGMGEGAIGAEPTSTELLSKELEKLHNDGVAAHTIAKITNVWDTICVCLGDHPPLPKTTELPHELAWFTDGFAASVKFEPTRISWECGPLRDGHRHGAWRYGTLDDGFDAVAETLHAMYPMCPASGQ